jgi:hypothetical protein
MDLTLPPAHLGLKKLAVNFTITLCTSYALIPLSDEDFLNADKKNEIFAADHSSIETHTGPVIAQHQFYNYNTGS